MKNLLFVLFTLFISASVLHGQYEYEASVKHPFGMPNPAAPDQIKDYHPLIGICKCQSEARNQDGSWQQPEAMTWEFKYIMNGMGVQDQTLKADGGHSGSIRQYIADSSQWYVHYYSSKNPTTALSTWSGGKVGDDIILYKSQMAPNGMEGSYKITFSNISDQGFNWLGEWVNTDESMKYPTWKIECTKQE